MKINMKKLAAWMLALLLVFQMMPALAESEISNVLQTNSELREKLEISASNGSYLLINQSEQLSVPAGYTVEWNSSNEDVATIDSDGYVTAVGAGETQITAKEGTQTAKETITVINPDLSYAVTYEVKYPADAVIQLYPDIAPSKPQSRTFTVKSAPTTGGETASIELDSGTYDTDNYKMIGWADADGNVHTPGEEISIDKDVKMTAVFEGGYEGGAKKGKSRFLATDGGTTYFTTGASDKNAPDEYKNEKWKFLSIYCYPSVDENGNKMYTFRLPEATREVRNEGEGYNINTASGAASKTFIGYRLLKILGVDDISAYTDKVYGISEQVTLPMATTADGYYFAPVFEEGQTGEAQVRINYNGKTTYISQGKLTQAGMDALAEKQWTGSNWQNMEASIGGNVDTPVDSDYIDEFEMPSVKSILRSYGMSAENPDDWDVIWYKIARSNVGYYIVGHLVKEEEPTETKENMVIVINGKKGKLVYNGEEQSFGEFVATSNDPDFDPEKVKVVKEGGIAVSRKDCGITPMPLTVDDFAYDDPDANPVFVVSSGSLKITPATVTVSLSENLEKIWGQEDPDYSEYLVYDGLYGDDKIDVKVTREQGEEADFYTLSVYGDQEKNGNYKVQFEDGILVINMPPITIKSSLEGVESAPAGTEVTLTAEMDGLDTEHYNIQWQMGETADVSQMEDISGANDISYTYILDETTADKYFRVVVTLK